MNELQQTEFDLLRQFTGVCRQLNLRYFLVCGSALGAQKYAGFIPWDDDIDVAMPREDYDVFMEKAQSLLPEHIFLQNYRTDPHYPHYQAKLRNSSTTFLENTVAHLPMNHGVFLDIFPLDGYPAVEKEQKRLEGQKTWFKLKQQVMFRSDCSCKVRLLRRLLRLFGVHKRFSRHIEKFEKAAAIPTASAETWCNHGNWQGKKEYAPRWHYVEGKEESFEGLQVCIPESIDDYLTQKYGNWREDLPESEKVGHHYHGVLDLSKPYQAYLQTQKP